MRLPQKMFKIDDYVSLSDAYHFVRKTLPDAPPVLAHSHDFFELFLVEQGQIHHWINGLEERLEPGHLTFIRPADCHAMQAVPSSGARILNVMFRKETAEHLGNRYASDLAGKFFWSGRDLPVSMRLAGPQMERAVNAMLPLQTSHTSLARIEHFLLSMMTHVLDASQTAQDTAPAWLLQAAQAVRAPREFRRGAEGLIEASGRSQAHVCRAARRYLGLSPTQYVNRIRIQYAAMLLADTSRQIAAIAEECGFENLSYFHRLFREQYGTTPRGYRQRHAKTPAL